MKTIRTVNIKPEFTTEIPEKKLLEYGVLYISKQFRVAIHLCLCGTCNIEVCTPLTDNFWQLTESDKGVSLTPSIGNYQYPCKSHYIITNNKANFV